MRTALLLLLLGAGCARPVPADTRAAYAELVVPPAQCAARAPEAVEPGSLARDVEVLERLVRRGYAGFEQTGGDARWSAVFERLRADLPDSPTAPLAFRDLLLDHLSFVRDAHVGLWVYAPRRRWRSTTQHEQAWIATEARFTRNEDGFVDASGRILTSCEGVDASELLYPAAGDALPRTVYVPIVLSAGTRDTLACVYDDGSTQALPLRRVDIGDGPGETFERRNAPFPWLRLRTLFTDQRGALDRFVATATTLRDAPVIVLDLRRGRGGSDVFLLRWFRALSRQPIRYWRTDRLASETTLQGALTFWGCVRAAVSSREGGADPTGAAWLEARVLRARRELDRSMSERGLFRERVRQARVLDGRAPHAYRGRLLLVVDRGCGSACETAVLLARQLPRALVVGENTEGAMKVGELRHYRLPESHVWISLGMRAHTDPEGRFEESRGFLPDLWLDGSDPDDQIRDLARCLGEPACARALDDSMTR